MHGTSLGRGPAARRRERLRAARLVLPPLRDARSRPGRWCCSCRSPRPWCPPATPPTARPRTAPCWSTCASGRRIRCCSPRTSSSCWSPRASPSSTRSWCAPRRRARSRSRAPTSPSAASTSRRCAPPSGSSRLSEVPPQRLAELTAGMTRVQLAQILDGAEAADDEAHPRRRAGGEEGGHRDRGPGAARVRRAEVRPRHGGRHAGGQGAPAARGPGHRARQPVGGADGLPDLRPGGERQDLPRRVLLARDRLPVREAQELPLDVGRLDRGEPRAHPQDPRLADAGRRGHRRGRRRARQPRAVGRLGHPAAGLRADRDLHGRHPQPRQDPLVPDHRPARPAADRPQAPGAGGGAHPALLPRDGRRVRRDLPGDEEEAQLEQPGRESRGRRRRRRRSRASRARTSRRCWCARSSRPRPPTRARSPRST